MYDLHIHSDCSDGADNWKTILQKAEALGLLSLSITDHDNCEVYTKMERPEAYFSGRIITGIEMQAWYKGISIEILGYGFEVDKMRALLPGLYLPFAVIRGEELRRLHAKSVALGMRFAPDVVEKYDPAEYFYATEYLHREMRKFPENRVFVPDEESWQREHVFFKRHTSRPGDPFYVDESDLLPGAEKVSQMIRAAGGKVFMPHVFGYGERALEVLHGLADAGCLDGVECYYPTFTAEQTEYLLAFCKERGLGISGGSDWHGANRPENKMGVDGECFALTEDPFYSKENQGFLMRSLAQLQSGQAQVCELIEVEEK